MSIIDTLCLYVVLLLILAGTFAISIIVLLHRISKLQRQLQDLEDNTIQGFKVLCDKEKAASSATNTENGTSQNYLSEFYH